MMRPASLQWRAALAMSAAMLAVFMVLFAAIGYTTLRRGTGDLDIEALFSMRKLAQALDAVESRTEAEFAARMAQQTIFVGTDFPPLLAVVVQERSSGALLLNHGTPALDWTAMRVGTQVVRDAQQRELHVYVAEGQRWRVMGVDDGGARQRGLVGPLARDIAMYLAWVLPLLVLPVWFAVRSSLAPLKQLTRQVQQRAADDTHALVVQRGYSELEPLVSALNDQFRRAALRLQRERNFVQDAAHELRTPLAVISAQAHVLSHAQGEARVQVHAQLERSLARASHVAQQLLQLARAEAPERAPVISTNLMAVTRDCLAAFEPQAARLNAELMLDGADRLDWPTVPTLLRSMLDNLVDNALRHGQPDGGSGAVEVQVLQLDEHHVQLSVADRGPGIAAADRDRAFERFWRARREDGRGSGLGLAIVRESARALGGEARLQARADGPGCQVLITLPRTR
jgi:two-component system, OmpR family, sensor histidine kinase QseC